MSEEAESEINLDNSVPLYLYKTSNFPEFKSARNEIFEKVCKVDARERKFDLKGLKATVEKVILSCYVQYMSDPNSFIGIHRWSKAYVKSESRYRLIHIKFANMMIAVDCLIELGFIEQHIGTYNRERQTPFGRLTRIRATPDLIKIIVQHKVLVPMVTRSTREEVIHLNSGQPDKTLLEYEDTERTHSMRNNLLILNKALSETNIDLKITDQEHIELNTQVRNNPSKSGLDISNKTLIRVFTNSSFTEGGRFYGAFWQNLPKGYRPMITIDNKSTVEIDYSGMHIRILLANKGIPLGKDEEPYSLEGFDGAEGRKVIKLAFNMMINSVASEKLSGRERAKRIIAKEVITTKELPEHYKTLYEFLDAMEARYQNISEYFYCGIGARLQYLDSIIAEKVMLKMLAYGEVALPVHDSFIVKLSNIDLLNEVMEEAFVALTGADVGLKSKKKEEVPVQEYKPYDAEEAAQEMLQLKMETETGSSEYSQYRIRQAQWYSVYPMTYRPSSTGIQTDINYDAVSLSP